MFLLWEKGFCWKILIVLGYIRGYFFVFVIMEMDIDGILGVGVYIEFNDDDEVVYLLLVDYEGKFLLVFFLMGLEVKNFFLNVCIRKWYKIIIRNV